ncbi:hypothetical protein [Paenibacillus albus]|uniref:Uncharacterized protein n=1 Tax=Paenibacillus albus TaxID=2495582 RepID=A0A3Q8XA10_9BACL|nr:hypothetical protein [Paenibacillus albus]AZN43763.1 hypothetical protein EJC50_17595 [Paenibacillus albus]
MQSGLNFGIYPLSAAGTPAGLATGPDDDYAKVRQAINDLNGGKELLIPRNYFVYAGPTSEKGNFARGDALLEHGLMGDLVIGSMQESDFQLEEWLYFVRKVIARYGSVLRSLQITNEPNLSFMEGARPYTQDALIRGVITAKEEAGKLQLKLPIGIGSVPDGPVAVPQFWDNLGAAGGDAFVNSLDFIGHNFYVDVFEEEPLELDEVAEAVGHTLQNLREVAMMKAGIPRSVKIRVTENGWPTGRNPFTDLVRTEERQAMILESIIRKVHELRDQLNISHYVLFGLRDADSSEEDLFHHFGILHDDYTEKPAYAKYKQLIQELG